MTDGVLLGTQAADSVPMCSKGAAALLVLLLLVLALALLLLLGVAAGAAAWLGWRAGVGSVEPYPVSLAPGSLHLQLSFSSVQMG